MAYQKRVHFPGAVFRIGAQVGSNLVLFRDDFDYATFLSIVAKFKARVGFRVYGYALVPKELEIVIGVDEITASDVMHRVLLAYAKYYNKRYKLGGRVFARRHSQRLCREDESFVDEVNSVHDLPRRGGACEDSEAWFWSGYAEMRPGRKRCVVDDVILEPNRDGVRIDPFWLVIALAIATGAWRPRGWREAGGYATWYTAFREGRPP